MKYSSFIAASCKAIAVSRSSSRPILWKVDNVQRRFETGMALPLHFENLIGSLSDDERPGIRLPRTEISGGNGGQPRLERTVLYTLEAA